MTKRGRGVKNYTVDFGSNKTKFAIRSNRQIQKNLNKDAHLELNDLGIPRRLNGGKLGLRKRMWLAQQ